MIPLNARGCTSALPASRPHSCASVLEKSGIDGVHDGDALIVDVSRSHKGIAVSAIQKGVVRKSETAVEAIVVKVFEDRGYGFV
jgi:hypothetical protein